MPGSTTCGLQSKKAVDGAVPDEQVDAINSDDTTVALAQATHLKPLAAHLTRISALCSLSVALGVEDADRAHRAFGCRSQDGGVVGLRHAERRLGTVVELDHVWCEVSADAVAAAERTVDFDPVEGHLASPFGVRARQAVANATAPTAPR